MIFTDIMILLLTYTYILIMKNIIKHFILPILIILPVTTFADVNKTRVDQMRIVNINPEKFENEYETALNSDDIEGFNRAIFSFNQTIDDYFAKPLARGYRHLMPEWGRSRVRDFFDNLGEPRNFLNSLLQGDGEGMFRSFFRFGINSTLGMGGLHDFAGGFGLTEREKDFSQTLAVWGAGSGDYLVLPFFGPSTYRDAVGLAFDKAAEPQTYVEEFTAAGLAIGKVVSSREAVLDITDDMEEESFDLYSAYKSSYLQNRKKNLISGL